MESMEVRFRGQSSVEALFKGHSIATDQPKTAGGGGSAPSPFDLFLASIATCAGFYALRFCQQRGIATEGLHVSLETERPPGEKRIATLRVRVSLPPGFPEKYRRAIGRAVDQCSVKRHIVDPPEFEMVIDDAAPRRTGGPDPGAHEERREELK